MTRVLTGKGRSLAVHGRAEHQGPEKVIQPAEKLPWELKGNGENRKASHGALTTSSPGRQGVIPTQERAWEDLPVCRCLSKEAWHSAAASETALTMLRLTVVPSRLQQSARAQFVVKSSIVTLLTTVTKYLT